MQKALFDRVKAFLAPHLTLTAERRARVEGALRDCPNSLGNINWEDARDVFTHALVRHLVDSYGDCGNTPAIVLVLREIASTLGTDKQAEAEKLVAEIMGGEFRVVDKRYKLLRQIGDKSGQGDVFFALDTQAPEGLPVVLKLFKSREGDYHTRFFEEIQSVARLETHPHIVPIKTFGTDLDGTPYLVMPVMSGSLVARLTPAEPLAPDVTLDYLRQIANALDAAHREGIVHRDLKPANFLFTPQPDERLCLSDFGIARRADRPTNVTQDGETAAMYVNLHGG